MRKKKELQYYSLKNLLAIKALYRMVIGERSNGKSFAILSYCMEKCWKNHEQFALVRRWKEDFRGKRGEVMFAGLSEAGEVKRITGGVWTDVYYYGSRWYWCRYEEEEGKEPRLIRDQKPFCYAFALSDMEHDKSTSYPEIKTVFFDEFLSRSDLGYLSDEFVIFMNVLSTIIRDKDDVEIFMAANTVSQYAPYFQEMGLTNVKKMKPGDIELYQYGDSGLTVALEFSDSPNKGKGKPSDKYFAFDNPRLSMITGQNGIWEFSLYPHCPTKYVPRDIRFTYFIDFDGELLQAEIIQQGSNRFTYIHRKTTPLQKPDKDLIYSDRYDVRPNWHRNIRKANTPVDNKVGMFFREDRVFYQDNSVGEVVRAYLEWCNN